MHIHKSNELFPPSFLLYVDKFLAAWAISARSPARDPDGELMSVFCLRIPLLIWAGLAGRFWSPNPNEVVDEKHMADTPWWDVQRCSGEGCLSPTWREDVAVECVAKVNKLGTRWAEIVLIAVTRYFIWLCEKELCFALSLERGKHSTQCMKPKVDTVYVSKITHLLENLLQKKYSYIFGNNKSPSSAISSAT